MLAFVMIFDLLTSSNAVTFSLVVPDGSISGPLGSSVVLPCTLSPSLDCKQYKISWYRPDNDDIQVLLYEDLKVKENDGNPQYRGRASLVGDLQKGNVSLKLENLTLADRGEYVCFVNAYKWYEMASVFTTVTVIGSAPYLSLVEVGDQVNVTCASDGWSPKPTLIWRDKRGKDLKNITDNYLKDSEGLVSVRSWLMFSPSDSEWISCSVGLSDQEMKEGRVFPLKILQSGWIAAFIVLLVISVLVISLLICLMFRVWQKPSKYSKTDKEARPLIGKISPPPCAVCTERDLKRADEGTKSSGEINPPPCAVCTERGTKTSGSAPCDKGPGSAPCDKGPGPAPHEEGPDSNTDNTKIHGENKNAAQPAPDNKDTTTADSNTNNPKKNKAEEKIAHPEPHEEGPGTGSAPGPKVPADSEPRAVAPGSAPGPKVPGSAPSDKGSGSEPHEEGPGSASGPNVPGSEPHEEGPDLNKNNTEIHGDNTNAAQPAPDNKDTTTADPEPVNKNTRTGKNTKEDSDTNNPKKNKAEEKIEWKKMQDRKVSIQPESETDLGVLFKERIRAGQYYWEVHGLTGPSMPTPSLRTYQQNKCPASWYVGVISETVMKNQLQLSPQNCWVLLYDKEKGFHVYDPSLTPVPVKDRMYSLGVFIDCEKNTLSFYNCNKSSHLYTFYNVDCTQPLVPVVFPGLQPQYSLNISSISCVKCDELYQHYGTRNKQSWS